MRFALLQRSLETPDVEKLKSAFRSVKCLTPSDAYTLANDAFGILVNNLGSDEAMTLQRALLAEGIDTAVVLQGDLPKLPPIKFVNRMDCLPESLMIYDPIGRTVPVQWGHVMLIAAGNVHTTVFEQQKVPREQPETDFSDWFPPGVKRRNLLDAYPDTVTKERRVTQLLLEIVLAGSVMRFQIQADKFLFRYLGDRLSANAADNFALLVQDLMNCAPHALVNRGAFSIRENPTVVFGYPSKNAFYEEMTWMLWQAANARPT